ncbi:hypothetical protein LCGC14_3132630, partial [marine sediment metagenome]
MFVYLAGPIKKDMQENRLYRARATKYLQDLKIDVFDPAAAWGMGAQVDSTSHSAALINLLAVKQSALVLAHYHPSSFGTNLEVGYKLAFNKPVVMWGKEVIEATSAMLRHPDITKCYSLEEALSAVATLLLGPGSRP